MPAVATIVLGSLLSLAATGPAPRSDRIPSVNIESTCGISARSSLGSNVDPNSNESCLKDEREARSELNSKWSSYDARQKRQCSQEISIGGSPSYVELLVCIEMKDWSKLPASTSATAPVR